MRVPSALLKPNYLPMKKLSMKELERKSVEEFKTSKKLPVIIVLDNVRSLLNVGSIFRTADAFSIEAIYLCGITGTPPNKEIQKTALGATDSVSWKYFKNTSDAITELKKSDYYIYAVEQVKDSIKLNQFRLNEKHRKLAFVFGNEVNGVDDTVLHLCDAAVEIPQTGTKHSLNVSVSAGIIMWETFRQLYQTNER
jgi:tRNA G18 (ribose-2'-O)-methylase SpoU